MLGVVLGCGGLVALVYGLGEAGTSGWGATHVIVSLVVVSAVLLSGSSCGRARAPIPLLPLRVAAQPEPRGLGSFITILLAVTGMFGTFLFLTYLLLQTIDHYSPLKTGIAFLPLMAMNAARRRRRWPAASCRTCAPGCWWFPGLLLARARRVPALHATHARRLVLDEQACCRAAAAGLRAGPGHRALHQHRHPERRAEGRRGDVGHDQHTSQQIGASIGTALLNTIVAAATATYIAADHVQRVSRATVHGYAVASGWAAGILVPAAVLAGILINVHPGPVRRDGWGSCGWGATLDACRSRPRVTPQY